MNEELAERLGDIPARSVIVACAFFFIFLLWLGVNFTFVSTHASTIITIMFILLIPVAFLSSFLPSPDTGNQIRYGSDYYPVKSSNNEDGIEEYSVPSKTTYVRPHMREIEDKELVQDLGNDEYLVPTHKTPVSGHFRHR